MLTQRTLLLVMTGFLLAAGGCAIERSTVPLDPKPILIHLPGVGGKTWFHQQFVKSLNTGGFDANCSVYNWVDGRFPLAALQDEKENRSRAADLAKKLAELARSEPNTPIYISCESGGAGMAVFVLEALPDDVQIEAVLMLAPAIDPDYDLTAALRHVRRNMLAFVSDRDGLILGAGTKVFGTMNGSRVESAGKVGFVTPPGADREQYDKLIVYTYDPRWLWAYGHAGNHVGALTTRFASGYLAPLLTQLALGQTLATRPVAG